MKIETLQEVAKWDWNELEAAISQPPTPDDAKRANTICRALVLGSRQVVEAETAAWSAELAKAVDQLRGLIKDQRVAVDALVETERKAKDAAQKAAATSTTGALRVKFEGATERLVSKPVLVAGQKRLDIVSGQPRVVVTDLPVGICKATVSAKDASGAEVSAENAVVIVANQIADVAVTIPKT